MKQALQKLEQAQFATFMEFLFQFSQQHVVTTRESGTFLCDLRDPQITPVNRREKIEHLVG